MKTPKWLGIAALAGLLWWLFGKKAGAEPPPPGKGQLSVTVTPSELKPDILVNGYSQGTPPLTLDLDPGTYTIGFGALDGYVKPPNQEVTIVVGEVTEVVAEYVLLTQYGVLVIQVLPSNIGTVTISIDGVVAGTTTPGTPLEASVLPGSHVISFSSKSGYITPQPITQVVEVGQAYGVTGVYTPVASTYPLSIFIGGEGTTDPPEGTWDFAAGSQVRIVATAFANWVFDHWENAATGSNPEVIITMNSPKTLVAIFSAVNAISFSVNAANLPSGTYYWGGVWTASGWSYSTTLVSPSTTIQFIDVSPTGNFAGWAMDMFVQAIPGFGPGEFGQFTISNGATVIADYSTRTLR